MFFKIIIFFFWQGRCSYGPNNKGPTLFNIFKERILYNMFEEPTLFNLMVSVSHPAVGTSQLFVYKKVILLCSWQIWIWFIYFLRVCDSSIHYLRKPIFWLNVSRNCYDCALNACILEKLSAAHGSLHQYKTRFILLKGWRNYFWQ